MKKQLGKGAIYLSISSSFLMIAGYIVNIFLGKVLGPSEYGSYGIIISLMTAVNLMQTAGLPQAVAKFIAEDESRSEEILRSGFIIQAISTLGLTILFFLFAWPLSLLLNDASLTKYIQLASLIFPFYGIFALYTGYYNGLHDFKRQAILNFFYALVKIIAILFFVSLFHLYGAIVGFIISPLPGLFWGMRLPKNTINSFSFKKLILFALPLIGVAIFANLLQSIDLFFIKSLLHSNQNTGFYTANQNIAEIPFYGVTVLASVIFPSISRHMSKNLTNETKNLINKSLRFSLMIITPSILLISATSLQVLRLLYSSAYSPGANSLAILAIGNGFFTLFVILATIISGAGSPSKSSLLAGLGVLMSSLLCIFLIPRFGLNGAALSTTIAAFIVMVFAASIVYKKFNVLVNQYSAIKILSASLFIFLLAKVILFPILFLPLLYIFLFAIYLGILFILNEITDEDIALTKSLLPKFLKRK